MKDKLLPDIDGKLEINIPYKPRPLQLELHKNLKRFNVLVCHRRFGKTYFAINEMIRKALECPLLNPHYAFVSPTIKQAKVNAWPYLKHFASHVPYTKFNESELKVTFVNGAVIRILGAENPDSARGAYYDGVVMDEVAQMPEEMWTKVLRPALSDRLGWAIFIGTPDGENAFYRQYERAQGKDDWYRIMLKASETGYVRQSELDAALEEIGIDVYNQEYECSFTSAVKGSYYASLIHTLDDKGQIGEFAWDPKHLVTTSWDIGLDKTVIWFTQCINNNIYVIDYYENEGEQLPHYANIVRSKPYAYKTHLFPHDVAHNNWGAERSRTEQLKSLGINPTAVPKLGISEGIDAARALLPRCYFNSRACHKGLLALKSYRTEWDSIKQVYKKTPNHDWASHAADSFRYMAVGLKTTQRLPFLAETQADYDPFKFKLNRKNTSDTEWDPFGKKGR